MKIIDKREEMWKVSISNKKCPYLTYPRTDIACSMLEDKVSCKVLLDTYCCKSNCLLSQELSTIEGNCYYCKKPVNNLAANPSEWGIPLCHSDEPGKVKAHHIGCVSERLEENESKFKLLWKLQDNLPIESEVGVASCLRIGIDIVIAYIIKLQNQLRGSHHICCNYPNRQIGTCNCEVVMKKDYKELQEQSKKIDSIGTAIYIELLSTCDKPTASQMAERLDKMLVKMITGKNK